VSVVSSETGLRPAVRFIDNLLIKSGAVEVANMQKRGNWHRPCPVKGCSNSEAAA